MTKLTDTEYEKLRKWINRVDYDPDAEYTYVTLANFKHGFVTNLATFLFDHAECRARLKRRLPADIYLRVLESRIDDKNAT